MGRETEKLGGQVARVCTVMLTETKTLTVTEKGLSKREKGEEEFAGRLK